MPLQSCDGLGVGGLLLAFKNGVVEGDGARAETDLHITQVVCVAGSLALVFHEKGGARRGGAAVFQLPQLQRLSQLSLHDVCFGCIAGNASVLVASSRAVRLLRCSVNGLELLNTVQIPGVKCACVLENVALVGTLNEYFLVNLKTAERTPLFNFTEGLQPLVCAAGPQTFLVVQGTSLEEFATGVFVDNNGFVAKNGAVVEWEKYPSSIAFDSKGYVLAVVGSKLVVHMDLHSKFVEVEGLPENYKSKKVEFVSSLSVPSKSTSTCANEITGTVAVGFEDKALLWEPVGGSLQRVAALIRSGVLKTVEELDAQPFYSPKDVKLMRSLLVLNRLAAGDADSKDIRRLCARELGVETMLYIYKCGDEAFVPLELIEDAKKARDSQKLPSAESFLLPFLRQKLKTAKQSGQTAAAQLEFLYAQQLAKHSEQDLLRLLTSNTLSCTEDVVDYLRSDQSKLKLLAEYFDLVGDKQKLVEVYLDMLVRAPLECDKALTRLGSDLAGFVDLHVLLPALAALPPSIDALSVLAAPAFEQKHQPGVVLELLGKMPHAQTLWRRYLTHLALDKHMFAADLATLVVAELERECQLNLEAVKQSYARFKEEPWPKPGFGSYLEALPASEYPPTLLARQHEFAALVKTGQPLIPKLEYVLEHEMPLLLHELALVLTQKGDTEQALKVHAGITDFRAVIAVAAKSTGLKRHSEIAKTAIELVAKAPSGTAALPELLLACAPALSVEDAVASLPPQTPARSVGNFWTHKLLQAQQAERTAASLHAAARAQSKSKSYLNSM